MLDIVFERTSAPITNTELLSVIDGIRPAIDAAAHPDKDYALLLARLVLRIDEPKDATRAARTPPASVVSMQPVPIKPNAALLRPFFGCPEGELELAWAAMLIIANAQQRNAA